MHYRRTVFVLLLGFASMGSLAAQEAGNMGIDEISQESLAKNPELKAMEEEAKAAKAQVPQARSWEDPQIGVRFYQIPWGGGLDQAMDIDYIISQKFPFPGKKKAAAEIAYHTYLHHLELLGQRGREILRDLKSTYFKLYAVQKRIELSQKIEANLKNSIQTAQAKLSANNTLALDSIQGQAELAKILSEKEGLKQSKIALIAKLNQLLFREESAAIKIPSRLELPHWSMSLEDSLEIALLRHPQVRIAEHKIEEKKWGIKAAKREFFPDMNAQVEYVQRPVNSPAANLGDAWTAEVMFNVPVLVKKKSKAVEQAEAELASAQYGYSAAKNDVNFKVRETYSKLKSSLKILELTQKTVLPQAQQAFDASLAAYLAGKTNFGSVLSSSRALFDSQNDYWKSFEAYTDAYSSLEESLGATREELASLQGGEPPLKAESQASTPRGRSL